MTKIKNTKKGMAKKTLSVSLAVAMLATSNVPVWAAEFSDGADAAFTSEVEAPVVEEAEAYVPAAQVEEDSENYKATVTFDNTSLHWNNDQITASVSVKDADDKDATYHWAWKVGIDETTAEGTTEGTGNSVTYTTGESDFGKNVYLYLWVEENNTTLWEKTIKAAEVGAVDLGVSQYTISWDGFTNGKRTYDGNSVEKNAKVMFNTSTDRTSEFTINYPDDLKNAGEKVITATINNPKYTGTISQTFEIEPIEVNAEKAVTFKATLKDTAKSYAFTGNVATFNKTDATLVDPTTGDDLSAMITSVTSSAGNVRVGDYKAVVSFDNAESVKNYKMSTTNTATGTTSVPQAIYSDNTYSIKARDLSDCVITIGAIQQKTGIKSADVIDAIKSVVAKDGTKLNLAEVKGRIVVELPQGGIDASSATPYTVTIKPTEATSCFTGSTTATVRVVNKNIDSATYNTYCAELGAEEYTGAQIIKDIAKLTDSKTGLKLVDGSKKLEYGADKNYTIEFGTNVNCKDGGEIIIVGHGDYEGSKKVIPFTISRAVVTANDLSASKYILHNSEVTKPEEYASDFGLVVKAHNTAKKEFVLTEGKDADYTVKYSFNTDNSTNSTVKATITLKTDGNFTSNGVTLTKEVDLVKPVLKDEYIQLKKDTYEYTGTTIIPEFDVVVNGKTLTKDVDYTIKNTQDVTNVGDAKVVITGTGKYSDKVDAEASFKVVPTDASKVKVTLGKCNNENAHVYNGASHTPEVEAIVLEQNSDVYDQFDITFGENINAGKGTVILTPKKNNKNFTGTKTVEFTIEKAVLNGTLTLYNSKNLIDTNRTFNYDGAVKTYASAKFTATGLTGKQKVTADDYEIVYADNVYGKKFGTDGPSYGMVMVVAKGNYKGNMTSYYGNVESNGANGLVTDGVYVDNSKKEIKNVVAAEWFEIAPAEVHKNNITVTNGAYNSGLNVEPTVTITVNGKNLIKDQDFKLEFNSDQNRTKVTRTNSLDVTIKPINGYKAANGEALTFEWGIDKFNFANAEVVVTGTDAAPVVKVLNNSVVVDPADYDLTAEKGKVTISAKTGSENYTGSKTVDIKHELEKPETPVLANVSVTGNTATAVLSGDVEGATGYDFVIGTSRDCITTKDYVKVNKNILKTETPFTYVQQGTYYAYCHAWKRDENGQKIFSDWSNAYPFVVTAITPDQPVITSVKASGSTVTVTYTQAANADGYDVVLGTATKKVAGETRPVNYGELVKKNVKGNTVTVTFKNVEKGTYYAGLHAFNRTSEDGKKVFSPWSNAKKVTVK